MRSVAPDNAGNAVSQNNWFLVKWKPPLSRLTTVTLQSDQMLKASINAGIDIHKLRFAIADPLLFQKPGSSGSHCLIKYEDIIYLALSADARGKEKVIQARLTAVAPNRSMKHVLATPVRSARTPNKMGRAKPARPPA